jgi:hypothetical protein
MVTVQAERSASGWLCHVVVDISGRRTEHSVKVLAAELSRWGRGEEQGDVQELVSRSFDFLLERESPNSILKSFELSAITLYFPEYDRLMRPQTK